MASKTNENPAANTPVRQTTKLAPLINLTRLPDERQLELGVTAVGQAVKEPLQVISNGVSGGRVNMETAGAGEGGADVLVEHRQEVRRGGGGATDHHVLVRQVSVGGLERTETGNVMRGYSGAPHCGHL